MKYTYLILLVVACGDSVHEESSRTKSECQVEEVENGVLVTCGVTSVVVSDGKTGPRGEPGAAGEPGEPGTSCYVEQAADGATITCGGTVAHVEDGEVGKAGASGAAGETGPAGKAGETGPAGRDGTDGIDGEDGVAGLPGSMITPVLPCPSTAGAFPEVLLCIDDVLYAVFVGSQTRYAAIPPGNYQTTDGRYCNFQVISGCQLN